MTRPEHDPEFEVLFDATYARVVRMGRDLLGNTAAGEHLATDALAQAFVRWRSVKRNPFPEAWVLREATERVLDQLGKDAKPMIAAASGHTRTDVRSRRRAQVALIRKLPHKQRVVVAMRVLAGLPESEVARALSISEEAVSVAATNAMAMLRDHLDADAMAELEVERR